MLDCAQYASIADMSSCCTCGSVRGHPKLSSFSQEYTEYAGGGGGGSMAYVRFFKMLILSTIKLERQLFRSGRRIAPKFCTRVRI